MYIPVILIAWNIAQGPVWVNFPMVNFPFTTQEKCEMYVSQVRQSVMKDPQYVEGYSTCVAVPPKGEQT